MPRASVKDSKPSNWRNKPNTAKARASSKAAYTAIKRGGYVAKSLAAVRDTGRAELKFVDTTHNQAFSTSCTCVIINGVAEGSENNQRTGRVQENISVAIRGFISTAAPLAATTDEMVRVIIFTDKQSNGGGVPTGTSLLSTASAISFNMLDNRDRFTILRDYMIAISYTQPGATGLATQFDSLDKKGVKGSLINDFFKVPFKTTYNTTTAVVASVTTCPILIMFVGQAAAAAQNPTFQGTTRVRYRDP